MFCTQPAERRRRILLCSIHEEEPGKGLIYKLGELQSIVSTYAAASRDNSSLEGTWGPVGIWMIEWIRKPETNVSLRIKKQAPEQVSSLSGEEGLEERTFQKYINIVQRQNRAVLNCGLDTKRNYTAK